VEEDCVVIGSGNPVGGSTSIGVAHTSALTAGSSAELCSGEGSCTVDSEAAGID